MAEAEPVRVEYYLPGRQDRQRLTTAITVDVDCLKRLLDVVRPMLEDNDSGGRQDLASVDYKLLALRAGLRVSLAALQRSMEYLEVFFRVHDPLGLRGLPGTVLPDFPRAIHRFLKQCADFRDRFKEGADQMQTIIQLTMSSAGFLANRRWTLAMLETFVAGIELINREVALQESTLAADNANHRVVVDTTDTNDN